METEPQAEPVVPVAGTEPSPSVEPPPAKDAAPLEYAQDLAPGVDRLRAPEGTAVRPIDPLLGPPPSGLFLFWVTFLSFVADVSTKLWAEKRLATGNVEAIKDHLQFQLAKNRGGAWGLLQRYDENVRRPFFLIVSLAAIVFIITLYRRLQPNQRALKWGLPLVLGGALGNVFDRIRYGHVIDFIDFRADFIRQSYVFLDKYAPGQYITDHWPTFNVADVAICVGVGLMAIDMFTSKRGKKPVYLPPAVFAPRVAVVAAEPVAAEAPSAEAAAHESAGEPTAEDPAASHSS